jgi:hypothetical protein
MKKAEVSKISEIELSVDQFSRCRLPCRRPAIDLYYVRRSCGTAQQNLCGTCFGAMVEHSGGLPPINPSRYMLVGTASPTITSTLFSRINSDFSLLKKMSAIRTNPYYFGKISESKTILKFMSSAPPTSRTTKKSRRNSKIVNVRKTAHEGCE